MIGGTPSLQRDLVRVVAAREVERRTAGDRAGLDVAQLRVALAAVRIRARRRVPEVVELRVEVRLGEAEEVREVVHPVVAGEQVRDGRQDVVAAGHEHRRVALARVPRVRPRIGVVAVGVVRLLAGSARPEAAEQLAVVPGVHPRRCLERVVADRRERRLVRLEVEVPRARATRCSRPRDCSRSRRS